MSGVRLVPGTIRSFDVELSGDRVALARLLDVEPVVEWPPNGGEHDATAVAYFRAALAADASLSDWLAFYVCVDSQLVGSAGFFGRPVAGTAEIGYSTCEHWRRRGYATAAVLALVERATVAGVGTLTARVRPTNTGSIAVLERNGFVRGSFGPDGRIVFARELDGSGTAAAR